MQKSNLAEGPVYHIFSRSIADYKIYNDTKEFSRMLQILKYYRFRLNQKLSDFLLLKGIAQDGFDKYLSHVSEHQEQLVQIIAYCLMPTHLHLIIKQLVEGGISDYLNDILNSYTRYFNTLHKRKGPLWEQRFKRVLVETDEQLLHLTRYLHLNPVTAHLVNRPEKWIYSSYTEYLNDKPTRLSDFNGLLEIRPSAYKKFVLDRIGYQRELAKIKQQILEI